MILAGPSPIGQWTDRPLRTVSLAFFDLERAALHPDRSGRICEMAVVDLQGAWFSWRSRPPPHDAVATQPPALVGPLESDIVVGHHTRSGFRVLPCEAECLGLGGLELQFADPCGNR